MFVAGAVWVENDAPACLRLAAIKDFFAAPLPRRQCRAGRDDQTDGWPSYAGAADVRHEAHVVGVMAAHVVLPWIHRAFSNAKTWALGVYQGLRRQHLHNYLDEFVFRFSRRRSRHAAFRSLLASALAPKAPYLQNVDRAGASGISLLIQIVRRIQPLLLLKGPSAAGQIMRYPNRSYRAPAAIFATNAF
jgi:hypothetical protein